MKKIITQKQVSKFDETKLISITRQNLTFGYQLVQSCHSIADFAYDHPDIFKQWKQESNSIITLAVKDEQSLIDICNKLQSVTPYITSFREPDIDNQMTAIAIYGTPEIRKMLCNIPLALKEKKIQHQTVAI